MRSRWNWGRWIVVAAGLLALVMVAPPALGPFFRQADEASGSGPGHSPSRDAALAQADRSMNRATAEALSDAFAGAGEEILPSVVTITSLKMVRFSARQDPFWRFFHRPFGDDPEEREIPRRGLGSGVIVKDEGIVLTNNHVVEGADELSIILADGRQFDAEIVGRDPATDLAVIQILPGEDAGQLPVATLGHSDELRVGDWVLAAGSPFRLSQTLTAGIVSAMGRSNLRLASYEDFIQTDAAINPGNSGGALVDLDGRVVGINTAIASRSGAYQGVGFAIPIDMARNVMNSILEHGRVIRGQLGVYIQDVNPDLAEALELDRPQGALVSQVNEGGPADEAGVQERDLILELNGVPVEDVQDLRLRIAGTPPGTIVALLVLRDGREERIEVELGELEQEETAGAAPAESEDWEERLGMSLTALTSSIREELELDQDVDGVVVENVSATGAAATAGLRRGDVIQEVGDEKISSARDFYSALEDRETRKPVVLRVVRGEQRLFLALVVPER
ncbi:MAG: Do family serine endopeptidase [Candidatus Eisenbacteria bacterium]|nr:Do family serine endopeptidase [Candidatus Eisenbacteria bacterium]